MFQAFNALYMMFHEATACHITNEIVELLKLIVSSIKTMRNRFQHVPKLKEWKENWKEHGEAVRKCIFLINSYTPGHLRTTCFGNYFYFVID